MNENKTTFLMAIAFAAIVFMVKMRHSQASNITHIMGESTPANNGQTAFEAPYFQTNSGIPDLSQILNHGPTFNSAINLNVNPSLGMQLSRSYIPLFGFVGVQTIGEPLNDVRPVTIH